MTLHFILVDDEAIGSSEVAGVTSDGTTITFAKAIAGTSLSLSGAAAITGELTLQDILRMNADISVNSDKVYIEAATGKIETDGEINAQGNLVIHGTSLFTNAVSRGAASYEAQHGSAVHPITLFYNGWSTDDTADLLLSLADGVNGQEIFIKLESAATYNMVVTPANFHNGTTLTFDNTGNYAHLVFVSGAWRIMHFDCILA